MSRKPIADSVEMMLKLHKDLPKAKPFLREDRGGRMKYEQELS